MPRFFFDLHDGVEVTDHTGEELPDLEAVMTQARRLALSHATTPPPGSDGATIVITARNETGATVATARLVLGVEAG